jgi:hypothetical protein
VLKAGRAGPRGWLVGCGWGVSRTPARTRGKGVTGLWVRPRGELELEFAPAQEAETISRFRTEYSPTFLQRLMFGFNGPVMTLAVRNYFPMESFLPLHWLTGIYLVSHFGRAQNAISQSNRASSRQRHYVRSPTHRCNGRRRSGAANPGRWASTQGARCVYNGGSLAVRGYLCQANSKS